TSLSSGQYEANRTWNVCTGEPISGLKISRSITRDSMKNRLVLVLSREALPDNSSHWVVVATYDNIMRANQHYSAIRENDIVSGKMMLVWDMFYGVEIDRLDWDDMRCGGKMESVG